MSKEDIFVDRERHPCRWCKVILNDGAKYCQNCHRSQGGFWGRMAPFSTLVSIFALVIAFGQLLISVWQNNIAAKNNSQSGEMLLSVKEAQSRVEEMKVRIQQLEKSTQESAHITTNALLQIKEIEARVQDLNRGKQKDIEDRKADVENARGNYVELQDRLKRVHPTIEVFVDVPVMSQNCIKTPFGGNVCLPVVKQTKEVQKQENPEYSNLLRQVDASSKSLQAAEEALSKVLVK